MPNVRASLLDDARVRTAFLVTDAEDQTSFEKVPFATMTLLSSARFASSLNLQKEGNGIEGGEKLMFGRLPRGTSEQVREGCALCGHYLPNRSSVSSTCTSTRSGIRYITSLSRLEILADVLRELGCGGGIIAGDFNAISPEDDELVNKNKLVDAWIALHGKADPGGATWGRWRNGRRPSRLDKVVMMGFEAKEMEVLRPGKIEVPRPGEKPVEIPWSDHCGLRCVFTL
jgi:tyrosyl-DNA phosphodiesterase 2